MGRMQGVEIKERNEEKDKTNEQKKTQKSTYHRLLPIDGTIFS